MDYRRVLTLVVGSAALASAGCGGTNLCSGLTDCIPVHSGATEATIKAAFDQVKANGAIVFDKGTFKLTAQLSVTVAGVTIKGQGQKATILDFKGSQAGQDGLHIETSGSSHVEGLTVQDAAANGIKILGAKGVVMRDVAGVWSTPESTDNGRYALYPVQSEDVLLENSYAFGSSDAGIYVGQCKNVIVRNNTSKGNVAGLEIENTDTAEVYGNTVSGNTAGLMVFGLPGLPLRHNTTKISMHDNTSTDNNTDNFAAYGGVVAKMPAGFGALIMAASDVEFHHNTVSMHDSVGIAVVSYCIADQAYCSGTPADTMFDPFPRRVNVHDNTITESGKKVSAHLTQSPGGDCLDMPPPADRKDCQLLGNQLAAVLFTTFMANVPNMLYDGLFAPPLGTDAANPMPVCFKANGSATFSNFDANNFDAATSSFPNATKPANLDVTPFVCTLDPLPAVTISGVQ